MILDVIHTPANYWCVLDFDIGAAEDMCETVLMENNRFVPVISVKLPYICQLGYNAVLKLDDKDYDATNPGVWCHRIHDLMDKDVFTHWHQYLDDKTL
jgi:hypothetical protein